MAPTVPAAAPPSLWQERAKAWRERQILPDARVEDLVLRPAEECSAVEGGRDWPAATLGKWKSETMGHGISGSVVLNGQNRRITHSEGVLSGWDALLAKDGVDALLAKLTVGSVCRVQMMGSQVVGLKVDGLPTLSSQPVERAGLRLPRLLGRAARSESPLRPDAFYNPYAYVRPSPRADHHPVWGRLVPVPLDRYDPRRLSGRVEIQLTTLTPFFSRKPVVHEQKEGIHEPQEEIPATSLKGAVRAVHETLTNACFGVFDAQDKRVGRRDEANKSKELVAVRIVERDGRLMAERMQEVRVLFDPGHADHAHFPYKSFGSLIARLDDGDPVWFKVVPKEVVRGMSGQADKEGLVEIRDGRKGVSANGVYYPCYYDHDGRPRPPEASGWREGQKVRFGTTRKPFIEELHRAEAGKEAPAGLKLGWLRRMGKTVKQKYFESVFFSYEKPTFYELTAQCIEDYQHMVADIQKLNAYRSQEERQTRTQERPSPYLWDPEYLRLAPGRLLYAKPEESERGELRALVITRLGRLLNRFGFRVALARHIGAADPETDGPFNTPGSLLPCRHGDYLCPSCRLFGWTGQRGVARRDDGSGRPVPMALRGRLRFSAGRLVSKRSDAIEDFSKRKEGGLPLAVLSSPKPNQAAFSLVREGGKRSWDDPRSLLAGRKFYWSQDTSKERWHMGENPDPINQPHRREGDRVDDQNQVIRAWVKAGAQFVATVEFDDLSAEELGSVLCSLDLADGTALRLGGGKPLGLGSFRCAVLDLQLREMASAYEALGPVPVRAARPEELEAFVRAFWSSLLDAYPPDPGEHAPGFVLDLARVLSGPPTRGNVHYPRVSVAPRNPGPQVEWFEREVVKGSATLPAPREEKPLLRDRRPGG